MSTKDYLIPKKRIEFGELRIGPLARKNLMDVCDTNWASSGPKVSEFQSNWNKLFNYPHSVALSSGTDACIQACLSLYELKGATPGDKIIVPALGFIATSNAVRAAGFIPIFVDIKKETLNIDEDLIEEAITEDTIAIMPVHTMGRPCEMDVIMDIANRHDLIVIEDCAEAHGASYKGKTVGLWGDMGTFSFYVAHLVCCGEGGMLSTKHENVEDIVNSTKCHGRSGFYFDHPMFGLNSKMNDLEASLGLEGLTVFKETFDKRIENVSFLRNSLDHYSDSVWFSETDPGNINCPHAFSITFKKEGLLPKLTRDLDNAGIHWKRNFGCIPTQHSAFKQFTFSGSFPNSEHVGDNGIHIGVHQHLTQEDLDYMVMVLDKSLKEALA